MTDPKVRVSFVNGDAMDCRRRNLAVRSLAYIKKDRVKRNLGSFRDEIAAAQAYDGAARELFGKHARLNFPDGVDEWLERAAA